MKKRVILLALSLLVLIFFACDYQIPTAIEIKGHPRIEFAEEVEIGKMFTSILDKAINENDTEGVTILPCEKTKDFTFLVHMELLDQDFDLEYETGSPDLPQLPDLPGIELGDILGDLVNHPVTLTDPKYIIQSDPNDPMNVPFSSIGNLLDGFEFDEHQIKLYFSGTDIVNKIKLDIQFFTKENGVLKPDKHYNTKIERSKDGIIDVDGWKNNGYTATKPPEGGFMVELPLNGNDMAVSFSVYIPAGETLTFADLQGGHIKVDALIWLPIVLKPTKEGAEITFPDDALFSSDKDLFGRETPDAESVMTDIIKSLKLEIQFNENPFKGSKLIVWSRGIEIENPLNGNSFVFEISEKNMQKINDKENYPFAPNFKLRFPSPSADPKLRLRFPRVFNATKVIFDAKIYKKVDL